MAVNVVNISNKAKLGNGKVTGVGSLNIAALMPESDKVKADTIMAEKVVENKDMLVQRLSSAVSENINKVLDKLGVNKTVGAVITKNFTEGFVRENLRR